MPNPNSEPQLYKLVNQVQKHWNFHSKTCQRIIKHRGKILKMCRFEFPRPAVGELILYNNDPNLRGNNFQINLT